MWRSGEQPSRENRRAAEGYLRCPFYEGGQTWPRLRHKKRRPKMGQRRGKKGGQTWPPLEHGRRESVLEGGTTDELTHDGSGWNLLVADSDEVMDELQETMGLAVFRAVFGH